LVINITIRAGKHPQKITAAIKNSSNKEQQ